MFDQNKYLVTEHKTTTEDGYILTFFRVNLKSKAEQNLYQNEPNSVIHLQHGIFDSSDMWFFNGEGKSVGFYLVDQGYDVWVGNNRGNKYSHDHVNDKISEYDFFNYSFDEMALYDVPAFYKYIQEQTNGKKLTWIGHSQGTSQFFAAALDVKTKVFIENNTNKFIALAPMLGFMGTVIGMIGAFDAIAQANDISPGVVAVGIKVALLTTVFGLVVAIILQIFYNYIVSKIDSIVNNMEDASIQLIDLLVKYKK